MRALALALLLAACVGPSPYQRVTNQWTRTTELQAQYQQILKVSAVYKSAEWRVAHAEKEADARGLSGAARDQFVAQARADGGGPVEFELIVTTWDRRENDLDRGKKASWRVRMLDPSGNEIEPLEILKDKRPYLVIRSEFPSMADFATAYVVRFPRPADTRDLRLRVSSERGGVEVAWR
jgi:hypothetical protein